VKRVATALFVASLSSPAAAQMTLAAEGSGLAETKSLSTGGAVDVRHGFRFALPSSFIFFGAATRFEVETLGGYWRVPMNPGGAVNVGRIAWGMRIGLAGEVAEPFIFGHGGVAFGDLGAAGTWDVGGAIEVRVRWASFGVHMSVNGIDTGHGDLSWVEIGPHVQVRWPLWR
jgi:hypothetical protein